MVKNFSKHWKNSGKWRVVSGAWRRRKRGENGKTEGRNELSPRAGAFMEAKRLPPAGLALPCTPE